MSRETKRYDRLSYTPFFKRLYAIQTPYLATPLNVARRMLALAGAKPGDLVVDLGCGDGRILIIAAKEYGCRCIGVEIDEKLANLARENIRKEGLSGLVEVVVGDLMEYEVSKADIVTLYLTPSILEELAGKLKKELKVGARVVSHDYEIPGWKYILKEDIPSQGYHVHRIFLYLR